MANKTKMMSWPQARKLWQLTGVNVHAVKDITYKQASSLLTQALESDGNAVNVGRKLKNKRGAVVADAPDTYDPAEPMTVPQGFGLRKRTGLDVRPLKLTGEQATDLFKRIEDEGAAPVIADLVARGCAHTPKSRKLLNA